MGRGAIGTTAAPLRPAARERTPVGAPDGETIAGAGAVVVAAALPTAGVEDAAAVELGR
ncbi:hypothetical protein [Frankia sp. ACN1ag]|uniref:hypothetical protein n=1 Tax=Frankia sp. ACN1ag TaxID=102891 RepID=UPI001F32B84C|nr:hypothetical protein [Frankia sp. ACN1ag]